MPTIEVSKAVHDRLRQLGGPLFSPSEVIARLLDADQLKTLGETNAIRERHGSAKRAPRERGAVVRIGPDQLEAISVRDMFSQVLKWLIEKGHIRKIEPSLPLRTSNQRYLISRKPIHPNKNPFVQPVEYKGYYMEAHKNYDNAMSGLQQLGKIAGISIEYV